MERSMDPKPTGDYEKEHPTNNELVFRVHALDPLRARGILLS